MTETEYFRRGAWAVTSSRVETPRADFELADISAVEISRAPLWCAIGLASAAGAAAWSLRHILYAGEMATIAVTAAVLAAAASQIAWLRFSGASWRGTETGRVFGPLPVLKCIRRSIRQAQLDARRASGPEMSTTPETLPRS